VLLNSDRNPAEIDVRGTEPESSKTQAGSSARTLPDREAVWRKYLERVERVELV